MAIIHPSGWRELSALGAAQREIETLEQLSRQLPDSYTVFHGVHWTRLQNGFSVYGEVDFVVIAPNARVLLIEQKLTIAMQISDRALVMGHGSMVFDGTPDALRANAAIRKEWLEV